MAMQRYPFLAKYLDTSQWEGIVLFMTEPHHGIALYIPPNLPAGDPRHEAYVGEIYSPATSEIEVYTGSVIIRGDADPELDD